MERNEATSERYNPITGTGIPANPARANTSAIFGGSPGAIEYMFIPPSASTRPTRPSTSEKRRSLSRESLRRSFSRLTEDQADLGECSSSVPDVSEAGSDQRERPRRNSSSLPKARPSLSRSTSSRLPRTVPKPCVMKRAHSFTRGTTGQPARVTPSDPDVAHSETDLINQAKKTEASAMSKIPRKASVRSPGAQSSRIPLKRADGSSNSTVSADGSAGAVIKRTPSETQGSGIPVKTSVQKPDNSREPSGTKATAVKTGTTSGIPVKSSGIKTQQHPGASRIPQARQERTQANVEKKSTENERRKASIENTNNDVKIAMHGGTEPLLKREGTGDELRGRKQDVAKSKLPRRSSIPRSNNPKLIVQQKTNKNENNEAANVKSKRHDKKPGGPCSDSKAGHLEKNSASKIPVNQRTEVKTASGRSTIYPTSTLHRSDSGYGDTDSASSKEDAPMETGNVFCLSRENSKSKIPIMSRKGRVDTKHSGGIPSGNDVAKALDVKKKAEKQKHESLANSEKSIGKHTTSEPKLRLPNEEKSTKWSSTKPETDVNLVAAQPLQKDQSNCVAAAFETSEKYIGKKLENDTVERKPENVSLLADSGVGTSLACELPHVSRELPHKEHVTVPTKEHSKPKEGDALEEHIGLGTRMGNREEDSSLTPESHSGIPSMSSDNQCVSSNAGYRSSEKDLSNVASTNGEQNLLSARDEENSYEKDGVVPKTGTSGLENLLRARVGSNVRETEEELKNGLKEPGEILTGTNRENIENTTPKQADFGNIESTREDKAEKSLDMKEAMDRSLLKTESNVECKMNGFTQGDHVTEIKNEESKSEGTLEASAFNKTELTEGELPRRSLNCFECRLEQKEKADEDILATGDTCDDVTRYPTFISPRKSLVFCKRHEKLKDEDPEPGEPLTAMLAAADCHTREVSEEVLPPQTTSKELARTGGKDINVKMNASFGKVTSHKMNNNICKKEVGQKTIPKQDDLKSLQDGTSGTSEEPAVKKTSQRSTTQKSAREKAKSKAAVPKGSHSPLLALSRDKKFVSREDLAQVKNIVDIKSAFSLEWDDVGTELDLPNFSDEEDALETGSENQDKDSEDNRRPSVKLMNTNEALDKLKVIQSLIMKEAESRSRRVSEESTGKYTGIVKGPVGDQMSGRKPGNYGAYVSSNVDKQQLGKSGTGKDDNASSNQVSPTDLPENVSSPTIWDRITDSTISQDQTTELLNETLAKLKASPQLSGNTLTRRTISSRSLPGSRQASKERLLSDAERPVYVYTSSWMNTSGKNSRGSSLSLCSANRSLPSSRQNLTKDPFSALKRSESESGRMDKENGKRTESKDKFRLSNFDEMLSDDGIQDLKNHVTNHQIVSPVSEQPIIHHVQLRKPKKRSKPPKKSKNSAVTMNNMAPYGVSMDDLADGKTKCQCGGKKCVIS